MTNQHPSLRFDHREIAVIFSLFVFVSLLMFTVGILVGKGLAQAKYESSRMIDSSSAEFHSRSESPAVSLQPSKHPGTSITTREKSEGHGVDAAAAAHKEPEAKVNAPSAADEEPIHTSAKLKLIPQRPKSADEGGDTLLEPNAKGVSENILKNPQIASLLEEEPSQKGKRSVASASVPTRIPQSYANGKYTVQIGSYPTEKDATDRVEALKKLGFPYAHFSAKELGDNKETWFRVWLGFYPDYQSANDSGRILKDRGEVRHYLVRKSDTAG